MDFYLGAHHPHWLALANVPLFVSRRALSRYRTMPRASAPWALDSGGFTELSQFGTWLTTPAEYVADVRRYRDEIGRLEWAAPQDWMCEPVMLRKTGMSVRDHQELTIRNLVELRTLAPELPFVPVLQGWVLGDYLRHAEQYDRAGIQLERESRVGVGTVCRRQNTEEAAAIMRVLAKHGLKLHGFGFKLQGLQRAAGDMRSADSMAWSYNARRNPPISGHRHRRCANCLEYALRWREKALHAAEPPPQLALGW